MHRSPYLSRVAQASCAIVVTLLFLAMLAPGALAQTHVANPFVGATQYVNPDYANEIDQGIAAETDPVLIQKMQVVKTYPTAVWMDRIAAINGGNGRLGLTGHLNAALQQQQGSTPIVVTVVVYDLPDRDCAARASNGEISIAANPPTQPLSGLDTYKTQYIDQIFSILSNPAYANIRVVAIIEPDSLPNLVTNAGGSATLQPCVDAKNSGVYVQGVQYAISRLHTLPNVYSYLDIGHSGWLGWPNNMSGAIPLYTQLVSATPAGFSTIDGFITNTANTLPVHEPFMNAGQTFGGQQLISASFYEFNPHIEESTYAQALYQNFVTAGFPAGIGMLIDTSRNGWGGPNRPAGASTSTDLNTFVTASKIDRRAHRGLWCNPMGAGIGAPPQAAPAGFFAQLDAFVWIKPPGESDGTYPGSANQNGALHADPNCDPAQSNPLAGNTPTGAYPNSPPAGAFFVTQFHDLVANAFPAIPTNAGPDFSATVNGTSVMQGATATTTVTVNPINGFTGNVTVSVGTLPTGVTATVSPATITGANGVSTITFSAAVNATPGPATVAITAASGAVTHTSSITLNVVARPDFTISVTPTSLSVPAGGGTVNATATLAAVAGFTGNISLSAGGLPNGVSANFSPSSVNTSGTSAMNFVVQPSAAAGTFPISITGTAGTLVHSATLTLVIGGGGGADFSLAAAPAALSVVQGTSGTSTITITRTGTFASAISFTAAGMPTGVTASFAPATTTTTGTSSILTLAASGTATTGGPVTITITGTGGGLTHMTSVALTVTPANNGNPNFSLSATPPTLSVAQGASGTSVIAVTATGGFTSAVSFTASGMPTGVTAAFNPTSSTTSSTLTLTVASTATAGTSMITVTGTGGGLTRTATVTLTIPGGQVGVVTATPVISQNSPFFNDEQLKIANTAPISNVTVTIVIQRTTGVGFSGMFNTVGSFTQTNSSTASAVTYTFTNTGTLGVGTGWTFAAQSSGSGTLHPTAGDTFSVSYTANGAPNTVNGHF